MSAVLLLVRLAGVVPQRAKFFDGKRPFRRFFVLDLELSERVEGSQFIVDGRIHDSADISHTDCDCVGGYRFDPYDRLAVFVEVFRPQKMLKLFEPFDCNVFKSPAVSFARLFPQTIPYGHG